MRCIELAKHLAQHIAEVVLIIDMRQELLVDLLVSGPVYTVQIGTVELIVNLSPDMLEQVLALGIRTIVERSLELDSCATSLWKFYSLYAALREHKEIFLLLVGLQ